VDNTQSLRVSYSRDASSSNNKSVSVNSQHSTEQSACRGLAVHSASRTHFPWGSQSPHISQSWLKSED